MRAPPSQLSLVYHVLALTELRWQSAFVDPLRSDDTVERIARRHACQSNRLRAQNRPLRKSIDTTYNDVN